MSPEEPTATNPFLFIGCAELREILGKRAEDEKALADLLEEVPAGSVYYHTHSFFLRHRFIARQYPNDFAAWVAIQVRDPVLGERLAVIDPFEFRDLEALREEIVSVIDDHLSRIRMVPRVVAGEPFDFMQSHVVEVPTGVTARTLREFRDALAEVDASAIYFHLMGARVRQGHRENDFSTWIEAELGLPAVAEKVGKVNPYLGSLERIRSRLLILCDEALAGME